MRYAKRRADLAEVASMPPNRNVGHVVTVVFQALCFSPGERVHVRANLADQGLLNFLRISVPVLLETLQFAGKLLTAVFAEVFFQAGEPPEGAGRLVRHATIVHEALIVLGQLT